MKIISKIRTIIITNINTIFKKIQAPETRLNELIREIDDNIGIIKNEMGKSIELEKRLSRKIKKEILLARKKNALARQAVQSAEKLFKAAAGKNNAPISKTGLHPTSKYTSLHEKIIEMESKLESMEEILNQNPLEDELSEQSEHANVDDEIERELQALKKKYDIS